MESLTCRVELPGWRLVFAGLELSGPVDPARLAAVLAEEEDRFRRRLGGLELAGDPVIAALRELFKQAGTSPSKYRPSSEALGRRVLRGEGLPRIHPLVDLNNLLSLATLAPCCVMRPGSVEPPLVLRRGGAGEAIHGLRGPFELEGKPVLADMRGPFGTPITDDHRVVLQPEDRAALLVAYVPAAAPVDVPAALRDLAGRIAGVRVVSLRQFD